MGDILSFMGQMITIRQSNSLVLFIFKDPTVRVTNVAKVVYCERKRKHDEWRTSRLERPLSCIFPYNLGRHDASI